MTTAAAVRDLRFWWTDEIYSEYRFFRDHPEEPKKFLVNLHQDMTGARQSYGSRVQHLIHAPHSITSYLDALLLSIGTYVIQTNNAFLSASRAGGLPRPFTRPIYSTRGSREGFHAAFVPYFGQSDYMCFVEGAIGVPAVALINWDDPYIHSSDDEKMAGRMRVCCLSREQRGSSVHCAQLRCLPVKIKRPAKSSIRLRASCNAMLLFSARR